MSTAPKSMSSKLQHPLRSGHFSYFCNMLWWKASSKIITLPACTAFSTAKKELYLQYIRFKFSNNSIPTCPICCCIWHTSRAACDFKKGHHQQQQQTFGWLDSGWLERSLNPHLYQSRVSAGWKWGGLVLILNYILLAMLVNGLSSPILGHSN